MNYKLSYFHVYGCEEYGSYNYGIQIKASLPDISAAATFSSDTCTAIHRAVDILREALMREVVNNDPEQTKLAHKNRAELLGLFIPVTSHVSFKEIPNEYCSRWCCSRKPWFLVTTRIGVFKLGWRKRVIQLDWTDTVVDITADSLFPNEQVTKVGRSIHAWELEDAARYIKAIFDVSDMSFISLNDLVAEKG